MNIEYSNLKIYKMKQEVYKIKPFWKDYQKSNYSEMFTTAVSVSDRLK